ncbi:MAG: hypothetical protein QM687_10135 [Ferruginibacter sp.]
MKKLILATAIVFATATAMAQETQEVTKKNSWLKLGLNAGVPVGDLSDYSSFVLGADLKGQLMSTKNVGIGLTTGYNHFFAKDGYDDFGTVPLGAFVRFYPQSKGFFIGTDLGYSFVTKKDADGGVYVRPQIGYHNYDWNFFGFYNGVFRSDSKGGNIQHVGLGATYNIRFN